MPRPAVERCGCAKQHSEHMVQCCPNSKINKQASNRQYVGTKSRHEGTCETNPQTPQLTRFVPEGSDSNYGPYLTGFFLIKEQKKYSKDYQKVPI